MRLGLAKQRKQIKVPDKKKTIFFFIFFLMDRNKKSDNNNINKITNAVLIPAVGLSGT